MKNPDVGTAPRYAAGLPAGGGGADDGGVRLRRLGGHHTTGRLDGIKEGRTDGLRQGRRNGVLTCVSMLAPEQVMVLLEIPRKDRKSYAKTMAARSRQKNI